MSKSLGNFFTVRDLIAKGYSPLAIRHLLISAPYRKQLNFTIDGLKGDETRVKKLQDFRRRLHNFKAKEGVNGEVLAEVASSRAAFEAAMDDDLNTSAALAAVSALESIINKAIAAETLQDEDRAAALTLVNDFDRVLGIFGEFQEEILDSEIQQLIEERLEARRAKNFARSDEIRKQLAEQGIVLRDTKDGTDWSRG